MTVPKWLLPVIAVVAAVAVGVSLAIVGVNFASKQVAARPAGTVTLPVLAPVASGLSAKSAASQAAAGKLPVSKVTGQTTVVSSGASLGSTGLQQAIRRVADGHASGDGADTPASSSSSTSTPEPTSSPSGPSGDGGSTTANDPCSPTDEKIPVGCPDGTLHGAIFADTIPPDLDFSIAPFAPTCGTVPIEHGVNGSFVDAPVTITTTVPERISVQWRTITDNGLRASSDWQEGTAMLHQDDIDRWNDAAAAGTDVPGLPPLRACFNVPNLLRTGEIVDLIVAGRPLDNDSIAVTHEIQFRPGGAAVLPRIEAETFASHDYFVAYTEAIPGHAVDIRAYRITQNPGATCADVSHLPELSAQGERLIGNVNPQSTTLDIPLDYTERVANGYIVPPGAVVLVCAKWYHGHEVPSFDRTAPYHTSSIIERAPDALLPTLTVVAVNAQGTGAMNVTASGSTIEGINCGSAQVQLNSEPLVGTGHGFPRRICAESPSALDSATDDPTLRGEMVVTSDVERRGGQHVTGQFVIPRSSTVCTDCGVPPSDTYQVPLPNAPGTSNSMGTLTVVRGWDVAGTSGLRNWISEPQTSIDVLGTNPADLPQLNTDVSLVSDNSDAVAPGPALSFALSADQSSDYSITLTGLPGTPPCTMGPTDLTQTGHYSIGSRPAHVVFTHLCFHSVYLAQVTLTGRNGSTQWGFQSGNNRWPRYVALTPSGQILVTLKYTASVPAGQVIDGISISIDGHTGDAPVVFDSGITCVNSVMTETESFPVRVDGGNPTLNMRYQVRSGTQVPGATSGCTITPGGDQPAVDDPVDIDLDLLFSHGNGEGISSPVFSMELTVAPIE